MLEWTQWKKAYPRPNWHENHQLHNGPIWSPGHRNVEAWIELHAIEQWAFSLCKAKPALHARPLTENERFGRWPVWPSEAEILGVGFQKKIPGLNGLRCIGKAYVDAVWEKVECRRLLHLCLPACMTGQETYFDKPMDYFEYRKINTTADVIIMLKHFLGSNSLPWKCTQG